MECIVWKASLDLTFFEVDELLDEELIENWAEIVRREKLWTPIYVQVTFNSNLCPRRRHVSMKGLLSRILVCCLALTIREWQSCSQKLVQGWEIWRVKYSVLSGRSIRSYGLVVKASRSESGNVGSNPARCWNSELSATPRPFCVALSQWARQCTDMRAFILLAARLSIFLSRISSVTISRSRVALTGF